MRLIALTALAVALPSICFAVGDEDPTPAKPTETSTECKAGEVFDEKTKSCLDAKSEIFDDDTRYAAVRELAYDGQLGRASMVLDAMAPDHTRVLTYRGFIARKTGDAAAAFRFYTTALEKDPDNLLARAYMGQGLVVEGDLEGARAQLREIRTRGGRNSWPEFALRTAIENGPTISY